MPNGGHVKDSEEFAQCKLVHHPCLASPFDPDGAPGEKKVISLALSPPFDCYSLTFALTFYPNLLWKEKTEGSSNPSFTINQIVEFQERRDPINEM